MYDDLTPAPEAPDDSTFARSGTRRRLRRPLLASAAAVGLVVSVGGAAVADPGFARLLRSPLGATTTSSGVNVADKASDALVNITVTNKYDNSAAAGTGMILTTNGEILTNNHVVEDSTTIKVEVVATGKTYAATVVGTDKTDDVAVIQLKDASGLETLPIGNASDVQVGDDVTATGNAGGKGGTPSTVSGAVTALNQSITATDEDGSNAETLSGLIETNAPIQAGDSGGALIDSDGAVIGMNTAASVSNSMTFMQQNGQTASQAYAIPIQTAISIADRIEAGEASSTIQIGATGFLGVELQDSSSSSTSDSGFGGGFGGGFGYGSPFGGSYGILPGQSGDASTGSSSTSTAVDGVEVAGVVSGGPAATAGIVAGDTITAVNGTTVASATDLSGVLAKTESGQRVTVKWTGSSGQSHSATVTLDEAPAA